MRVFSCPSRRFHRLLLIVLAAGALTVGSVGMAPSQALAGTLVVPAWAFDRGNGRVHVDPETYADASPGGAAYRDAGGRRGLLNALVHDRRAAVLVRLVPSRDGQLRSHSACNGPVHLAHIRALQNARP